jgi:drug/metabolite transporter (DMT)-like permease
VKTPAVILIVVGVVIVIWGAFGFRTTEKVVDIGPIHATREKEHNIPYGPLAGGLLVLGGVILLVKSKD